MIFRKHTQAVAQAAWQTNLVLVLGVSSQLRSRMLMASLTGEGAAIATAVSIVIIATETCILNDKMKDLCRLYKLGKL